MFNVLEELAEYMWVTKGVGLDFNTHWRNLYQVVPGLVTTVMDGDTIQVWEQKLAQLWNPSSGRYESIQVLFLCRGRNRTGMDPPGEPALIYSAAIIWVAHNQSRVTVTHAIKHLRESSGENNECGCLCYMPLEPHPYWPYPPEGHYFILPLGNFPTETWCAPLDFFQAFQCISFIKGAREFVIMNAHFSGREDV